MVFLLWVMLAVAAGTLATYLYDEEAGSGMRLAQGVPLGLTGLGLLGYVVTAWLRYTGPAQTVLCLVLGMTVFSLARRHGGQLVRDVAAAPRGWKSWLWLLPVGLLFALLYERVLVVQDGHLFTGYDNNLGDITYHLGIIMGFAAGDNFPPENPEYAGTRLTYPFLMDFLVALALRNGIDLQLSMWAENLVLTLSLIALCYRFTLSLTESRVAAALSPVLMLGSGGLGFLKFFEKLGEKPLWEYLRHLPHDYTINVPDAHYRWGNAVTVLLVPQRALLLGLPLAFIIWRLWWIAWRGEADKRPRRLLAAAVITGFMPLAHAHSFLTTMMVAVGLALLAVASGAKSEGVRGAWESGKAWLDYGLVAAAIAAPQAFWATRNAAAKAGTFFEVSPGWDHGVPPEVVRALALPKFAAAVLKFWWLNAGLFIPLWLAALAWLSYRRNWRLVMFNLPFAALFLASNLFKLSPWIWDNIKFLFVWYLGSVPLVAWLLSRLPQLVLERLSQPGLAVRAACHAVLIGPLLVLLTLSGGLDVWRILAHTNLHLEFDPAAREFAGAVARSIPPRSRMLTAGTYNNPVELTGRRLVMGYGGHLWSHGVDYSRRENSIREIYHAAPNAKELLRELEVDYIVVGPQERGSFPALNEQFFQANFPLVLSNSGYNVYKAR